MDGCHVLLGAFPSRVFHSSVPHCPRGHKGTGYEAAGLYGRPTSVNNPTENVYPNMAEFESVLVPHFQSPWPRS